MAEYNTLFRYIIFIQLYFILYTGVADTCTIRKLFGKIRFLKAMARCWRKYRQATEQRHVRRAETDLPGDPPGPCPLVAKETYGHGAQRCDPPTFFRASLVTMCCRPDRVLAPFSTFATLSPLAARGSSARKNPTGSGEPRNANKKPRFSGTRAHPVQDARVGVMEKARDEERTKAARSGALVNEVYQDVAQPATAETCLIYTVAIRKALSSPHDCRSPHGKYGLEYIFRLWRRSSPHASPRSGAGPRAGEYAAQSR